jgi:IS4 transposase
MKRRISPHTRGIHRMDRATLLDLLGLAQQHIVLGRRQIDDQYRIIAKLESEGHDTAAAVDLLKQFVEAQELYERDRDRLMTKLATAS